ncbi:MAG: hypoxanthine phosphoribosyltransferase [Coriobacteriales bacterium]|nr:hypoxanthine phosphoribosyltransferase [Coriobacteriales bacterium]
MHPDLTKVLFNEKEIAEAVARLGKQISTDYAGKKILLVSVLKGAFIFMADLLRQIKGDVEIDFMAVASYGVEANSSGVVRIIKDLETQLEDRHVLIVEDILDSGLTLSYLIKNIRSRHPLSLEIVTLLIKEGKQEGRVDCKYVGLVCPDEFVVGYGLDYSERYREIPYIGALNPAVYDDWDGKASLSSE